MLYDGDCPLCMKEVDFLRNRDKDAGKIDFVNISDPAYNPDDNAGVTFEQAMGHIHGITREGRVVKGVEVFQKLYEAVDLGWVYAVTKWKPVYNVAEAVYGFWAKYRLPLTGRPALEQVLESRKNEGLGCGDEDTACEIPLDKLYPKKPQ